jgi:hypothetical protein
MASTNVIVAILVFMLAVCFVLQILYFEWEVKLGLCYWDKCIVVGVKRSMMLPSKWDRPWNAVVWCQSCELCIWSQLSWMDHCNGGIVLCM